jgi:hypothetical protein
VIDLYYPIINNISRVDISTIKLDTNAVVAFIACQVYWRDLIRYMLPAGSNGIVVVIESPCSEKFTYQLFGLMSSTLA